MDQIDRTGDVCIIHDTTTDAMLLEHRLGSLVLVGPAVEVLQRSIRYAS